MDEDGETGRPPEGNEGDRARVEVSRAARARG